MRYDLNLLYEFCCEIGLAAQRSSEETLQVSLGDGAVLCFQNADVEEDCLLGFADTPWHTHGDLLFSDCDGSYIQLDSRELLSQLKEGKVLLCECVVAGQVTDRWLIHSVFNDEFAALEPDERLVVRRASDTLGRGVT